MFSCSVCGKKILDEKAPRCPSCGAALAATKTTAAEPSSVPKKFKLILIAIAFAAIAGSLAIAVLLIYNNKNTVRQRPAASVNAPNR